MPLRTAICILNAQPNETANGVVTFSQAGTSATTKISGNFSGLTPNQKHGFHIHIYGNLSQGCTSTGAHFNPLSMNHSSPVDFSRHAGDLGNVQADSKGNSIFYLENNQVLLYGKF